MPLPKIRENDLLLRLIKDVNDIKSALRRTVAALPLFDIANENTPPQLTANQNNYVPGNFDTLRLSSDHNVVITGIRGGVKGRRLQIFNVGNYSITLAYQNSLSDTENRFKFQSGTLVNLASNANIWLYYDSTQQRWIQGDNSTGYDFGATWSTQTAPNGYWYWRDIVWSAELGLFCSVGQVSSGILCRTSPDGETWTSQILPPQFSSCMGVTWSATLGIFCAVGTNGSNGVVAISSDGINWAIQAGQSSSMWNSVVWATELELFVAIGYTSGPTTSRTMYSADGVNWFSGTPSVNATWNRIAWSGSLGLLVAVSSSTMMVSTDAINWTTIAGVSGIDICWSDELGLFAMCGAAAILISADGSNWDTNSTPTSAINSIAWSPDYSIFIGLPSSSASPYICVWSQDGITWQSSTLPVSAITWTAIEYAGELSRFVAVSTSSTTEVMTAP